MECQICFETFDTKSFIPKMLTNCGHSFCKICIERLIGKRTSVQCPVCREKTRLVKQETLPTNYSLVEIIDKKEDLETSKSILEKYKYFDEKIYSKINTQIVRYYYPKKLVLKKIINDDFIYVEEFEGNQNVSIFNNHTQRNKRYNFNKHSILGWLLNEYSLIIWPFRKSSKCSHSYSCTESFIRRAFVSISIVLLCGYPLSKFANSKYSNMLVKGLDSAKSKGNFVKYCQYGLGGLLCVPTMLSCLMGYYVDELMSISSD